MSIEEFNARNRQLQTKEGKRAPAGIVFYHKKSNLFFSKTVDNICFIFLVQVNFKTDDIAWAYKKGGIWYNLPRDVSEKVEKAYGRNKQGSTILELNGCM